MFYERITSEQSGLGDLFVRHSLSFGMLVLETGAAQLLPLVQRLHADFGCDLFLDVTAVDRLPAEPRFELVYHFMCTAERRRIRIKLPLAEQDAVVATLTGIYGSARFMEREVHEMYGIHFEGNGDLRPILLYEGFVGHPLRKDYPMDREQPIVNYRR